MVTRNRTFGYVSLSHAAACVLRGVLTGVLVVKLLLVHLLLLLMMKHHLLLCRCCIMLAFVSCFSSCRLYRSFVVEHRVVGVVRGVVGTPTPTIRVVPSPN